PMPWPCLPPAARRASPEVPSQGDPPTSEVRRARASAQWDHLWRMGRLDQVDLSLKLKRKEQNERLEAAQERLSALRLQLGGLIGDGRLGPPVLALFECWDASGKGGAIKRLTAQLDHRHVRGAAFSAPTHDEKLHHFFCPSGPALPG